MAHQGGTYSGEVLDGIPNGIGTWISPDGQQYVGQWQDGFWHGEGTLSAADGSVSTGEYQNGKRNGQSTWSHPDGRKYVGEFRDDQMHGQGVHTFSNGDRYAGTFENGKQHGQGTYTFSDGSVVAGDWQNGKPWQAAVCRCVGAGNRAVHRRNLVRQLTDCEVRRLRGPGEHPTAGLLFRSSAVFRPFCLPCLGYGVDNGQLIDAHPAGDRIECFDPFPVALPADKHQTGALGKNSEH